MNKHIELVKKYLTDPFSVSLVDLDRNRDDAAVIFESDGEDTSYAAYCASNAACMEEDTSYAAYWVARYEKLTEERYVQNH
jgi:hypothetical protein